MRDREIEVTMSERGRKVRKGESERGKLREDTGREERRERGKEIGREGRSDGGVLTGPPMHYKCLYVPRNIPFNPFISSEVSTVM